MASRRRMVSGLIEGLKEAAAHSKGTLALKERTVEIPGPAPKWTASEIRRIRTKIFQCSQPTFAALLSIKPATVRSWEQGQKKPSGAAARLLQLLELNPESIDALNEE